MVFPLLALTAAAREFPLDRAATAVTVNDVLVLSATEIDLTPVDFGLILQVQNVGHTSLDLGTVQCGRGSTVVPISGSHRNESIGIDPGETRTLEVLCDHGRDAAGDPSIRLPTVYVDEPGVTLSPVLGDVVWTLSASAIAGGGGPLVRVTSSTQRCA